MKKQLLSLFVLTTCLPGYATQLVQGNAPTTTAANGCPSPAVTTFQESIQTSTYDKANGIFYVGLASGASNYAVSSFQRTLGSDQYPRFTPRATQTTNGINNGSITHLAMASADGDTCSRVVGVDASLDPAAQIFILDITNKVQFNSSIDGSSALKLYTPTLNANGSDATNIVSLAANRCFAFAGVTDGTFGDTNSGVAVVAIDQCSLALGQTAAVPGDAGIKAQQLNNASPVLQLGSSTINIQNNTVKLYWDDQLERLYAGMSMQITPNDNASGGLSTVVGTIGLCPSKGTLTFQQAAPSAAFAAGNTTSIVGVIPGNTSPINLSVNHLGVMHCSTGPSYLIVNGGNGTAGNTIYAMPLVDLCDPTNIDQGLLADITQYNTTTHRFDSPAFALGQLAQTTDLFAQVGNGPLPISPTQTVYEMQIVGDAVYVSLSIPQDVNNETGLLYSQALFDNEGKILSWTPWSKRAWPICGFPDSPSNGQVSFFAVDAVTGKITAVDGTPQETVRITNWEDGSSCDACSCGLSLAQALNKSLCQGSYAVLDLDQSTSGIGESTPYRYALFGGTGKVDFALISQSRATSAPFDINTTFDTPSPQLVTLDYSCPDFFLETTLSGCVTSLEYSRSTATEGAQNYFFAGTANGLYVFANSDGTGFNVADLGLLSAAPFKTGVWHKIAALSDPIISVKTFGNSLYVMTFSTSCARPFYSEIKRIDFADNITSMFGTIYTIARSGNESLSVLDQTLLFTQMAIIETAENDLQEQLVVTTNNGIFQSMTTGGVQLATDEISADWTLIQDKTLFYGIGSVDNASILSTVWPFSAQDACGLKTFERSSIHQLNGQIADTPTFTFVPTFFNHVLLCNQCGVSCDCPETSTSPCQDVATVCSTSCDTDCCVTPECVNTQCNQRKLFEKINYFWSDGGRRFFIITPTNGTLSCVPCCGKNSCLCCPQQNLRYLNVFPFNTCIWNVCDPSETTIHDSALRKQSAFYWLRPIGMTGIILSGTQTGVVALE